MRGSVENWGRTRTGEQGKKSEIAELRRGIWQSRACERSLTGVERAWGQMSIAVGFRSIAIGSAIVLVVYSAVWGYSALSRRLMSMTVRVE